MDLRFVTARGLKGLSLFEKGLAFDYAQLPEGLIGIVGPNGAGKTSILELPFAALYGQFPSRPDSSLLESATDRDTAIDVEIAVDGRGVYRARVQVDPVARATDAVLELTTPDGRRQILNDGKISTFKAAVAKELPSPALLLASAFAAQNKRGAFATLSKKDRRDLFAELLGLAQYEPWATTARAAAGQVDRRLAELRALVARLLPLTTPALVDACHRDGNRLQLELSTAGLDRTHHLDDVARLAREVEDRRVAAARSLAAAAEIAQFTTRRLDRLGEQTRIDADRRRLDSTATEDRRAIESRRDRAVAAEQGAIAALSSAASLDQVCAQRIAGVDAKLATKRADLEARIQNNQELIGRADAIRAAVITLDGLEETRQVKTRELREVRTEAGETDRRLVLARQGVTRETVWPAQLEQARTTAALITRVPCHGAGEFAGCELLAAARAAEARIPNLEAGVRRLAVAQTEVTRLERIQADERAEIGALDAALTDLQTTIGAHTKAREHATLLKTAETRVAELRTEIVDVQHGAETERAQARAAREEAAGAVALDRARRLAAIEIVRQDATRDLEALTGRVTEARTSLDHRDVDVAKELTQIGRDLAALEQVRADNHQADDARATAEAQLVDARTALEQTVRTLARLEAETATFAQRRHELQTRIAERDAIEAAVVTLETDLIEWQALARMMGREGLPVLEIDAAGPGVSALANDLLQACFGSRFTVELITQDVKVDGKGFKEVFELQVYDSERGGGEAKDLGVLSGGEQVIVDEAVKSAIALYVNRRNVLPIRTCWRDETIGALDPENALRYVAMLRRLRERGGFKRIYFISHNLDAAALADAQLVVADGTMTVRYPPFGAAVSEAA